MTNQTQGGRLSFDNLRELYPPSKYIYLLPVASKFVESGASMWALDVTEVKISPDDDKMAYQLKTVYNKSTHNYDVTEVGLSAVAINLLCAAADVTIVTAETKTSLERRDPMWRQFGGFAIMSTPTGGQRGETRDVDWDGPLELEKVQLKAEEYIDRAIEKHWSGYKDMTLEQRNVAVEKKVRKDWLQEREFGPRKAQSKAARNAATKILALKGSYSVEELKAKRFAVAKFVFSPDTTDPETKRFMLERGASASRQLYGGMPMAYDPHMELAAVAESTLPAGAAVSDEGSPAPFSPPTSPPAPSEPESEANTRGASFPPPSGRVEEAETEPVEPEAEDLSWEQVSKQLPRISMDMGIMMGRGSVPDEVKAAFERALAAKDANTIVDIDAWLQQYKEA